jgi:hypothetical protein
MLSACPLTWPFVGGEESSSRRARVIALFPVASRPLRTIFGVGAPRICDSQPEILLGTLQLEVIGSPEDKCSSYGTHQMEPIVWKEHTERSVARERICCSRHGNLEEMADMMSSFGRENKGAIAERESSLLNIAYWPYTSGRGETRPNASILRQQLAYLQPPTSPLPPHTCIML